MSYCYSCSSSSTTNATTAAQTTAAQTTVAVASTAASTAAPTTVITTPAPVKANAIQNGLTGLCMSFRGSGQVGTLIIVVPCSSSDPNQAAFTIKAAAKSGTSAFCISDTICDGIQYNSSISGHTTLKVLMAADLTSPAQQWTPVSGMPNHFINGLTNLCAQAYPVDSTLGYGVIDTVACSNSSAAQRWIAV